MSEKTVFFCSPSDLLEMLGLEFIIRNFAEFFVDVFYLLILCSCTFSKYEESLILQNTTKKSINHISI